MDRRVKNDDKITFAIRNTKITVLKNRIHFFIVSFIDWLHFPSTNDIQQLLRFR